MLRCADALEAFRRGLEAEPRDPYCLMSRGFLLGRLGRQEEARADLRQALAGSQADHSMIGRYNALDLAVVLDDRSAMPKALAAVVSLAGADPAAFLPGFGMLVHAIAEDGDVLAGTAEAVRRLQTHYEALSAVGELYDLAGWRPECRERARDAAAAFYAPPAEVTARLKGGPTPEERWRPFLPFLAGRSDGAGDPRDLPLWCRDAAAGVPCGG